MKGLLTVAPMALVLAACGGSATIRHPAHVGGLVDPNEVAIRDRAREGELGLREGALVDTASLIELTPSRVCFHLSRWSLSDDRPRELSASTLALHTGSSEARREPRQITPGRTFVTTARGAREEERPGLCVRRLASGRGCAEWKVRPRAVAVPVDHGVRQREATACFDNDGLVTPETERLQLEVERREGTQRFEWALREP